MTNDKTKVTTQKAPLESLLTYLRTQKIKPYVTGKNILDFGCGQHCSTLTTLEPLVQKRVGMDIFYRGQGILEEGDDFYIVVCFETLRSLLANKNFQVDCITALASFEHLEIEELTYVLQELKSTTIAKQIVGTVPTPLAKPILEFLSYKLRLIDPSQIRDHKVYYSHAHLQQVAQAGGWSLVEYQTFQFGLNSFFLLSRD